ncbi:MAG: helix-turn-helix transcriptional regulator [Oscillospiraceae bacterium]|jgi:transcriptional regulator with XRE-family HTH domain|nr:helix-turn-helix transcriptional regulator [Oscillospiraceae bacterium]
MKKPFDPAKRQGFALQLYTLRYRKGITQRAVSKLTWVPLRTVENWEAGTRVPPQYLQGVVLEKISELDDAMPSNIPPGYTDGV